MKKLLSMALAMMLLFASVGVFAEGEATEEPAAPVNPNLVWKYGAEENEYAGGLAWYPSGSASTLATMSAATAEQAGITPYEGDRCVMIADIDPDVKGAAIYACFAARMPELEAGTHYRLYFSYYNVGGLATPSITISAGGTTLNPRGQSFAVYPQGAGGAWNTYMVDFVTKTDLAADAKANIEVRSVDKTTVYYDDFRLEKVDTAYVRFMSSVATSNVDTVRTGSISSYNKAVENYTAASADGKTAKVYGVAVLGNDATAFTGTVKAVASYIPKTMGETTALCVAIYNKDNVLQNLIIDNNPHNYKEAKITVEEEEVVDYYYSGSERFKTVSIDTTQYPAGSYAKAFMWSSAQGMLPMSDVVTLGK